MIIIDEFEQNTEQWDLARLGNPGASQFSQIVTSKGVPSDSRTGLLKDLAGEILTGRPASSFNSWKMKKGLANEAESRRWYEWKNDVEIIQVAMCYPDKQKMYHCSPDGLMPDIKKGFETKDHTETPRLQIERLEKGTIESQHWIQCQGSLLVTGYDSWIYQSFCKGKSPLKPSPKPLTIEVFPDWRFLAKLQTELESFCFSLAILVKKLKEA